MAKKTIIRGILAVVIVFAILYCVAAIRYASTCGTPRGSCREHRKAGCTFDGDFTLKVGSRVLEATCDMTTDGGGWTLVANYLHKAGVKGSLLPLMDHLPRENGSRLGSDESGTPAWGHASTLVLAAFPFSEVRFSCQTSAHPRRLNFSVSSPRCLNYFRTGRGTCLGTPELREELRRGMRALEGNEGRLPLTADKGHGDAGDNSIMDYPFFIDWRENWSIGDRWQCDDTQPDDRFNTRHQIWIR